MEEKAMQQITSEFIREFAELNLEIAKYMREQKDYDADLLRELRDNAQALVNLI